AISICLLRALTHCLATCSCSSCVDHPDLHSFPTRRSSDLDLSKCLLNQQIQVVLVCTGPAPGPSQWQQVKRLQKNGLTFYHRPYRLEWMDDSWDDVYEANTWIREIYTIEKPALLHFNNYAPVCLEWNVPT